MCSIDNCIMYACLIFFVAFPLTNEHRLLRYKCLFQKGKIFFSNFAIKFQIFRYGTNFHHLEAKRNFLADSWVKRCCPCCSYFGCNRTVHWDSTIKSFYLCLFVHLPSFYFHKVSFSSQTFIFISKARESKISHREFFQRSLPRMSNNLKISPRLPTTQRQNDTS